MAFKSVRSGRVPASETSLPPMQKLHNDESDWLFSSSSSGADYEQSFYIGDAAGRAGDHNDTDRSTCPSFRA